MAIAGQAAVAPVVAVAMAAPAAPVQTVSFAASATRVSSPLPTAKMARMVTALALAPENPASATAITVSTPPISLTSSTTARLSLPTRHIRARTANPDKTDRMDKKDKMALPSLSEGTSSRRMVRIGPTAQMGVEAVGAAH